MCSFICYECVKVIEEEDMFDYPTNDLREKEIMGLHPSRQNVHLHIWCVDAWRRRTIKAYFSAIMEDVKCVIGRIRRK